MIKIGIPQKYIWLDYMMEFIIYLYVFVLFFLPMFAFERTSLLTYSTPSFIRYELFNINISYLFIPIWIFGILSFWKNDKTFKFTFVLILIGIFIKDIFISVFLENYIFKFLDFSLYFQIITAFFSVCIVIDFNNNEKKLFNFFDQFTKIHILGLLISIIVKHTSLVGRFSAQNLDFGGTAFLIVLYIIYILFIENKKFKKTWALAMYLLLFFTGSRIQLFFGSIILLFYLINEYFYSSFKNVKRFYFLCFAFAFVLILFLLYLNAFKLFVLIEEEFVKDNRALEFLHNVFFNRQKISTDSSFAGRLDSIVIGIEVIKNNILGKSFSIFDLQNNMQLNGYPTFPHSNIVTLYILMGPISIFIVYIYLKYFFLLLRIKNSAALIFLYLIIFSIFDGGAIVNWKLIFLYIFFPLLAKRILINYSKPYQCKNIQEK
jgi:hypothetical protein